MTHARTLMVRNGKKYFVRRNRRGEFKKVVSVSRSLSADVRRRAKTRVKSGQGDRGDRRR